MSAPPDKLQFEMERLLDRLGEGALVVVHIVSGRGTTIGVVSELDLRGELPAILREVAKQMEGGAEIHLSRPNQS